MEDKEKIKYCFFTFLTLFFFGIYCILVQDFVILPRDYTRIGMYSSGLGLIGALIFGIFYIFFGFKVKERKASIRKGLFLGALSIFLFALPFIIAISTLIFGTYLSIDENFFKPFWFLGYLLSLVYVVTVIYDYSKKETSIYSLIPSIAFVILISMFMIPLFVYRIEDPQLLIPYLLGLFIGLASILVERKSVSESRLLTSITLLDALGTIIISAFFFLMLIGIEL